jgi:hypothetical protein
MSQNRFILLNRIALILLIGSLFSCNNLVKTNDVKVSKRKILVDNKPYLIKGICYHPVPKGGDQRDFSSLKEDLALMVEAGINTIRVYSPIIEVHVLDEINSAGLKVIIGFGYNQGGQFDILSGTFIDYVNTYKSHKAILLWELGNEYNYHPEWFNGDIKNWYIAMNDAAQLINDNDSAHPVTTAHGDLPDSLALSLSENIDVWGINAYRWDDPTPIFSEWSKLSSKPMFLSEAGGDSYMTIPKEGYHEGYNEKAQADANRKILNAVFSDLEVCSGVTLFSFTDGWWKAGNNNAQDPGGWAPNSSGVPYDGSPNEEYWGIVDIDRNKKQTYDVVKREFNQLSKTN